MKRVFLHLLLLLASPAGYGQLFSFNLDSLSGACGNESEFNGCILIGTSPDSIQTYWYGFKNPADRKAALTEHDLFDLASLTKQFTGLAILKLMEENRLHPDSSIGDYFPELHPNLQRVSIRQLANHTNGIHDFYSLTSDPDTLNSTSILTLLSTLDTTVFPPGTSWGYSNSGYFLLSQLIERVSHMSFENYMQEKILGPMRMEHCLFAPQTNDVLSGFTAQLEPVRYNSFSSGSMGLYTSAADIWQYYKTISADTAEWKNYFSRMRELSDISNEVNWNYGFGWYFSADSLGEFRAHSGRNPGAYNYIRWYEKSQVFICILSNRNEDCIKPLREAICEWIRAEICRK